MNINVFNKLIKIVDIDHRKITYYLKQNPTQKITTFHKLGNNYIKEDFIDNNYDLSQIELPAHFTNKFKKRLSEFLENNKMKTSDCNMDLNRIVHGKNHTESGRRRGYNLRIPRISLQMEQGYIACSVLFSGSSYNAH